MRSKSGYLKFLGCSFWRLEPDRDGQRERERDFIGKKGACFVWPRWRKHDGGQGEGVLLRNSALCGSSPITSLPRSDNSK